MSSKSRTASIIGCLAVAAILVVIVILGGYFYMSASAAPQSVVFIREPQNGDRLEAGQPVQVQALARDDRKITRLELWVDGQLVDAQTSNTPGGINPFPLLTTWFPSAGTHTLIARSFNSRGATAQKSITVEAVTLADRDGDSIADETDVCPDQPGSPGADGCPDRDYDDVADTSDACPDEAGLPGSGCPAPSASDRDGDGSLDDADACPDEVGSPLADGCPDVDGDGVGDGGDACPSEPGGGEDGCPEPGGGDLGPEPGPGSGEPPEPLPEIDPPEPEEDTLEEGFVFPFLWLLHPVSASVEIEAYEMYVRDSYDAVWCYLRLGDEEPRRYDFDTLGTYNWDIAEELSGENSIHLAHAMGVPLEIWASCFGSVAGGEPVNMGEISVVHPPDEWDGRQFEAYPAGDNSFRVNYHICTPSCAESTFQAPVITSIYTGLGGSEPFSLNWEWDGDENEIDGYYFIVDTFDSSGDVSTEYLYTGDPGWRSLNIARYQPACGETSVFHMKVYKDTGSEAIYSPASNTISWPGVPCPRQVRVTFESIDVDLDYIGGDYTGRGPIYGSFWASGAEIQSLVFDGGRCWSFLWIFSCNGYAISFGRYGIAGMFDAMSAEEDGYAPDVNYLIVNLNHDEDLSFGGTIWDEEAYGVDHRMLNARQTILAGETLPPEISLEEITDVGRITLVVHLEEISAP